jgi:hypothetical protein
MAQASSRKTSSSPRGAATPTPRSAPQRDNKEAEAAAKASAEQQQKPMTAKAHAKAQEDFDADERIVQRSSYGDAAAQVTRHDGYQYFDPDAKKK